MIIALIPAHNEEERIADAVRSALPQVDRVVVVADNCTDGTARVARAAGADVIRTTDNRAKKAGALNQALARLLPDMADDDRVLVLDADTRIDPGSIQAAVSSGLDAACARVRGESGGGYVGWCQRNEMARYARDVARAGGRVRILSGNATVFRAGVLRRIALSRAPWTLTGTVYDEDSITEDCELTLALQRAGFTVGSPAGFTAETEVMPTWRALARQRLRWGRGVLRDALRYRDWPLVARHAWVLLWAVVSATWLAGWAVSLAVGAFVLRPVWFAAAPVFALERALTVRDRGLATVLLSAMLLPEMMYDLFLHGVHVLSTASAVRRSSTW